MDIAKHLEETLENLSIQVVNFAEEHAALFKYFPRTKETDLVACIRPMREITARETDARAVSNVFRLVSSTSPKANVFSSAAIFLSKNAGVVRQAEMFFKRERLLREDQASPFLTDKYMAGLLWVLKGGQGDDITRRKLVANCAAAVNPRRDVITKMYRLLSEINEKDATEFEALMTDKRAAYYVMEDSLGDATLVTEDNAHKILEKVRLATAEKVAHAKELEKKEALEEQASRHKGEMEKAAADKETAHQKAVQVSVEAQELSDEVLRLEEELEKAKIREAISEEKILKPCVKAGVIGGLWLAAKIHIPTSFCVIGVGWIIPVLNDAVYSIFLLVIWAATAFSQYWFLPNLLFGERLRNAQQNSFDRKVKEAGLDEIAAKFSVDWNQRKLIRK